MENNMTIKLKNLLVENTIDNVNKWFKDNKKRLSLKKFVDEINKIKGVDAEVREMTHDSSSRAGSRIVDRSKVKGLDIRYKREHFRAHTKTFAPIGNYSLVSNAINFLKNEIK